MPKQPSVPPEWIHRLEAMKRFRSAGELARECGLPPHKVQEDAMEIWHYPLGMAGGTLYGIHVAVVGDEAVQTYMFMEPSDGPDTARQRRP